jgi:hypothetical protein
MRFIKVRILPPPECRTLAQKRSEDSGEMTLIGEAAFEGNVSNRTPGCGKEFGGQFHTMLLKPTMRCDACCGLERSRKMLSRQAAFRCDIRKEKVSINIFD